MLYLNVDAGGCSEGKVNFDPGIIAALEIGRQSGQTEKGDHETNEKFNLAAVR
jgi:hypothetical protein